jgi:PAS domain S-box-containing protein
MDTPSRPAIRPQPHFRLYLVFSVVCLAAFAAATLLYLHAEAGVKKRIYAELSAIADLKLDQIVKWRNDRLGFAKTVIDDSFFVEALQHWSKDRNDQNLVNRLRRWMANTGSLYQFSNIAFIDSQCTILLSVKDSSFPADPVLRAAVDSAASSGKPHFTDLHRSAKGKIQIDLVAPFEGAPAGTGLFLVFEVDPDKFLFPLIQSWPMPSLTAETLLLHRTGDSIEYLNELRHRKNSALSFRLPLSKEDLLAADAVRLGTGVYDRIDYRDRPVLGAVRSIPHSPWYMVAKVDKAEIMMPVNRLFLIFLAFTLLTVACMVISFLLIYRHQRARYVQSLFTAEQAKSRSEERFRTLFESMTEGVVLHEIVHDDNGKPLDYRILDVNPAFTRYTGITVEKAKGRLATEVYHSLTPPYFEEYLRVVLTQNPFFFETFYPPMGKHFSISVFSPGIDLFATVFEDITKQKNNKEERKLTIEIFKLLNAANSKHELMKNVLSVLRTWSGCEAAGIRLHEGADYPYFEVQGFPEKFVTLENSLCTRDLQGQLVRDNVGNPFLECMCGNVICGRFDTSKPFFTQNGSFWSNCTTDLLASTTDADRQTRTRNRCNGEGYESVALIPLRASGVIFGLIQLNDKQKNRFTPESISLYERLANSIAIALAQRKSTEALASSEKRLAGEKEWLLVTLRSIGDGVITTDVEGRITLMNTVAEQLTGWSLAESAGRPLAEVFHIVNEKTRTRCENPVDKVLKSGGIVGLANHTALISKSGGERAIADSGAPIRDAESNIIGVVLVFRDITDRQKIEEALRNADKIESIGVLAGGIAHDFNNLLGGIFGYISMAIDEGSDRKTKGYLAKAMDTMERARALTRQLLTFSEGGAAYAAARRHVPLCSGYRAVRAQRNECLLFLRYSKQAVAL